ncbi:MAG: hypothetical protein Q4B85_12330 [Lachnospiraceae bacterium]|nr:hypothetical protein [Lachnospiraceae bacterium]
MKKTFKKATAGILMAAAITTTAGLITTASAVDTYAVDISSSDVIINTNVDDYSSVIGDEITYHHKGSIRFKTDILDPRKEITITSIDGKPLEEITRFDFPDSEKYGSIKSITVRPNPHINFIWKHSVGVETKSNTLINLSFLDKDKTDKREGDRYYLEVTSNSNGYHEVDFDSDNPIIQEITWKYSYKKGVRYIQGV